VLIVQTGPVAERVRGREIDDDEGRRLVRIVRRDSGPVVTWRRAQMVCCRPRAWTWPGITKVAFTATSVAALPGLLAMAVAEHPSAIVS